MQTKYNMSLFLKMILAFLGVFTGIWIFATHQILPLSTDAGATLASCLSAGATIYAALVAYLLLDNWKIQHKYQLASTYCQKTFNVYKELHESLFILKNHYDSWIEEIYRQNGQLDDFEDGGLISQINNTNKKLSIFVERISSYSLVFKDDSLDDLVGEFDSKLKNILRPLLDEYYEMSGQVDSQTHLRDSKSLKEEVCKLLEDYDKEIQKILASKIIL